MMRAIGDPNLVGWATLPTEWDVPGVPDNELEEYLERVEQALRLLYPQVKWTWGEENIRVHEDVTDLIDYEGVYILSDRELADLLTTR
jgi:hypothetical protein